jgi:catechol 2,3-dioxygenase-like lactoylglutathione lyase family enzyme
MKCTLFITLLLLCPPLFSQNKALADSVSTIKGINHISLSVRDLSRSIAFYKQAIGLEDKILFSIKKRVPVEKKSGIKHAPRKVAILQGPNGQVELIQFRRQNKDAHSNMPVQGPGITHICYQSSMSNSIYSKSKTADATIVSRGDAPVNRGYGIHYAYIRDGDSIMYEVEQFEKPPFTDAVWLGHVAIVTPDIDRLVAFYTLLLGTKPINRIDNIKNNPKLNDIANIDDLKLRGAWFKVGNMLLEMWQFENPVPKSITEPASFTKIGYQKIAFEVSDIQHEYKRLKDKNVQFLSAPVIDKTVSIVYLRDCDGNLISLHQFDSNSPQSVDKMKTLPK